MKNPTYDALVKEGRTLLDQAETQARRLVEITQKAINSGQSLEGWDADITGTTDPSFHSFQTRLEWGTA